MVLGRPRRYWLVFLLMAISPSLVSGSPEPPTSPLDEKIQCYSLPYGAIGFAQHASTYYKMVVLGLLRRPLMPWRRLDGSNYKDWNWAMSGVQIGTNVIIAIVTSVRCGRSWGLICMAMWKMLLAFTLGAWTLYASRRARRNEEKEEVQRECTVSGRVYPKTAMHRHYWWLVPNAIGIVIAEPGLVYLLAQNPHDGAYVGVSILIGAIVILAVLVLCLACTRKDEESSGCLSCLNCIRGTVPRRLRQPYLFLLVIGAIAVFSDWMLAIAADNLLGGPVGTLTSALYWVRNVPTKKIEEMKADIAYRSTLSPRSSLCSRFS